MGGWTAGAASLTPAPVALARVDVAPIAALSAAGLHPARAVAAVLLYRVITFKIVVSLGWFGYHTCGSAKGRRASRQSLSYRQPPARPRGDEVTAVIFLIRTLVKYVKRRRQAFRQ